MKLLTALAVVVSLAVVGCASRPLSPQLGELYTRAAMDHGPDVTPVIVIPGILGSRLVDGETGTVAWGAFAGDYARMNRPAGARLVALPMREGVPLRNLADGVRPDGALDRVRVDILGLPQSLDAYAAILGTLGSGGYRDQTLADRGGVDYGPGHFTCFQFDYDWRRDNVENAQKLGRFIEEKQRFVARQIKEQYGVDRDPASIRFDVVAHSMGGLIARYYMRHGTADLPEDGSSPPPPTWAGAANLERVILVATPSAGSASAVEQLVEGKSFSFFLPDAPAEMLGTMPAIYQLLPRPRHARVVDEKGEAFDLYDPAIWERNGWGLAGPEADRVLAWLLPDLKDRGERRRVAMDHQAKSLARARQFHEALDAAADRPEGVELTLFAGDAIQTPDVLRVGERGSLTTFARSPGDGTVTRASALLDERAGGEWTRLLRTPVAWDNVTFIFADHLGLTGSAEFSDNVLYKLLEQPRRRVRDGEVGVSGFEPETSSLSGTRSNQLSYTPEARNAAGGIVDP